MTLRKMHFQLSTDGTACEVCDVAVIGGGAAGICAAIQSGRAGARTSLVESASQVGGAISTGGVNYPGLFHAWGRQVISGIGWELVRNTVMLEGGTLPDFTKPAGDSHWKHQITVNIPLFVALAEEALTNAGVTVHYHAAPVQIEQTAYGWLITIAAAGDISTIRCSQIVDCTGNAATAGLLGLERLQEQERQPGSFVYTLRPIPGLASLDAAELRARLEDAVQSGIIKRSDCRWDIMQFLSCGGQAGNYIENADNSTAQARTQANLRGRESMLRLYRFLKTLPGLEKLTIESMSPEVGIRETYRVRGEYVITHQDYITGRRWDDSLCHAFYPVDMHNKDSGVHPAQLDAGIVPTVPLRAMVPKDSVNILAAGRCISSDRKANSGLRVQACCMATGQAAGATAALAAEKVLTPAKVPLNDIKQLLSESGAIVP